MNINFKLARMRLSLKMGELADVKKAQTKKEKSN